MNLLTAICITGGIVLAGLLAVLISAYSPENQTPAAAINNNTIALPINYDALDQYASPADLERGRAYYGQLCMSCHGATGNGQGEWAYRVTPRPANLISDKVRSRSDEFLFSAITDGLIGTPMMGWKNRLSDTQRWQLVNYMRHLGVQSLQEGRS